MAASKLGRALDTSFKMEEQRPLALSGGHYVPPVVLNFKQKIIITKIQKILVQWESCRMRMALKNSHTFHSG